MSKKKKKTEGGGKLVDKEEQPSATEMLNSHVLKSKLDYFESKSKTLESESENLRKEMIVRQSDENDVLDHMRRETSTKDDVINTLQDKIHELMLEVQDKTNYHEQKMEQFEREKKKEIAGIVAERDALKQRLEDLDKFQELKPKIEAELMQLRKSLDEERHTNKQAMADLVRQYDVKEALVRKELQAKKAENEAQLEQRALQRVDAITARTVRENMVKGEEIEFLHSEIATLKKEHKKLKRENKELNEQLVIVEEWKDQLLQRNTVLQSKVELQSKRIEELEKVNTVTMATLKQENTTTIEALRAELNACQLKIQQQDKHISFLQLQVQKKQTTGSSGARPTVPRLETSLATRSHVLTKLFPEGTEAMLVQCLGSDGNTVTGDKVVPFTARGRLQTTMDLNVPHNDRLPPVLSKEMQLEKPHPPKTSRT